MNRRILLPICIIPIVFVLLTSCPPQDTPPDTGWIVGYWTTDVDHWPGTGIGYFGSDKNYCLYSDYACTVQDIGGTYEFNGSSIIFDGQYYFTVHKIDNDTYYLSSPSGNEPTRYRKGTEPGVNLLDNAVPFSLGEWIPTPSVDIGADEIIFYSFIVTDPPKSYHVRWDDSTHSGSYTGIISVSACDSSGKVFFGSEIMGYTYPRLIADTTATTGYIMVKGYAAGNFAIYVENTTNPFTDAIDITVGETWVEGLLPTSGTVVYSFDAKRFTFYNLSWKDSKDGGPETYTADVTVSALTPAEEYLIKDVDSGFATPQEIETSFYCLYFKIYVVVKGPPNGGTFALNVKLRPEP